MMTPSALLHPGLQGQLPLLAEGKVRVIYELNSDDENVKDRKPRLLFVATDRISANDVVMKNGIPSKGRILTLLSAWWFSFLTSQIPHLQTHFITLDLPSPLARFDKIDARTRKQLQGRSMQVRRLKVFPIEAVVRGYITGSAWQEYKEKGTVNGIDIDGVGSGDGEGGRRKRKYRECEKLDRPLYTPSTKAEVGGTDVNIHPDEAAKIVGEKYAKRIEQLSIEIYEKAHAHALKTASLIIADTKFEFGFDPVLDSADESGQDKDADTKNNKNNKNNDSNIYLVDEVLTPDSSRFWPLETYEPGKPQQSFDKQYLRDWLAREGLKGKEGVVVPDAVVAETRKKYVDAYERITGGGWVDVDEEEQEGGG